MLIHHRRLYLYQGVDPVTDGYHSDGSLAIATHRSPWEAWLDYVDQVRSRRPVTPIGGPLDHPGQLGRPVAIYSLAGHPDEQVHVFPRGCCCDR